MTARFALTSTPAEVRDYFGYSDEADFPPRPSIAPPAPIAIVAARAFSRGRERRLALVRWGFVPSFAEDLETLPLIANARAEGLLEKQSFAAAFRRRRCLIPADAFYAGRGAWMQAVDAGPLGLAGLHETYLDPNGSEIDTGCLITVPANAAVAAFAQRMPAILPQAAFAAWLDCETTSPAQAHALLAPAPSDLLKPFVRPVS